MTDFGPYDCGCYGGPEEGQQIRTGWYGEVWCLSCAQAYADYDEETDTWTPAYTKVELAEGDECAWQ